MKRLFMMADYSICVLLILSMTWLSFSQQASSKNPQNLISYGIVTGACLFLSMWKLGPIRDLSRMIKKYHFLLEDMVARDLKLKYRRSIIGLLWSILNPLMMMIVITAVFQKLFRYSIADFSVYYLTGWILFCFVTEATTGAMTSVINSSSLIRKVYIPKCVFPLQKCVFAFVNMMFSILALVLVMLVTGVRITWTFLLIPIPLLLALLFSVGIGLILSTFAVFFRDMVHLYAVLNMVWMYLTPIIYPIDILPGSIMKIVKMNPLFYYIDYYRSLTMDSAFPGISDTLMLLCWSLVSLVFGIIVFKRKQSRFVLYI